MWWFDIFKKREVKPVQGFQERRILPRWQINGSAYIRWEGMDEEVLCQIRNLNLKGFAVSLGTAMPNECAKIALRFRSEYVFNVEIAVLWRKQAGELDQRNPARYTYGVKFTRIRDADKEKIYKMIREDFPELLEDHNS